MITEINQSGLMIDLTFRVSFAMFILLYTMVSSAALISLGSSVFFAVIFHLQRLVHLDSCGFWTGCQSVCCLSIRLLEIFAFASYCAEKLKDILSTTAHLLFLKSFQFSFHLGVSRFADINIPNRSTCFTPHTYGAECAHVILSTCASV